jgi:hypothetical protein
VGDHKHVEKIDGSDPMDKLARSMAARRGGAVPVESSLPIA